MALAIILVTSGSVPHWEDPNSLLLGLVDSKGWESLFFGEMETLTYFEYTNQGNTASTYEEYYADRIAEIGSQYPLLVRAKDYYQDAFFSEHEIVGLAHEIKTLRRSVKNKEAQVYLDQLLKACETALINTAAIQLSAD